MQIQIDKSTLPANDQQVRFRPTGHNWAEGYYIEEDGAFADNSGSTTNAFDVEEWEPLEPEDNLTDGERLRNHREQQGYTQAKYAHIVGLSRDATISDWEKGKKPVPGFMLRIMELEKEVARLRRRK